MNTPSLRPQPFPYASLPALPRAELGIATRLREASAAFIRPEAVETALTELVGEPVSVSLRSARLLAANGGTAGIAADGIGVLFAPADEPGLGRAALVDVEPALASSLVARALRQRAPRITDASRGASAEIAGALAAIVHAAMRRAHTGAPLRVVAAGPAAALGRDLAAAHGRIACASLTVVVGADAYDARVAVPLTEIPHASTHRRLELDDLAAMGDAPLSLPLVAMTCFAGRDTLGSLRAGDVFVLPGFPLRAADDGLLVGPVAIVAAAAERGLGADLGEGARLMLRSGPLESHPWDVLASASGEPMSGEPNPTLEVIEDAPVVVRVELGVLEMKAREWAALAPGDVVTLGRKLGEPVVLRAGGVEIARGELVQVDGEYGVRILGRAGGR